MSDTNQKTQPTEVVAAFIRKDGKFMICQRPPQKARGMLWEFVGGKVEPGETLPQALVRECREELNVVIQPGNVFFDVVHVYPDLTIHLTVLEASIVSGVPQKLEHNDIRWITPDEISLYEFCPADTALLERITENARREAEDFVREKLFAAQDSDYREFHADLMPTVDRSVVIGVRIPVLRKIAKEISKTPESAMFLTILPHHYYEENNLHGFLLERIRDFQPCVTAIEHFLPYVDNWATCDFMNPRVFSAHTEELLPYLRRWLTSEDKYAVRFGIGMLMRYYLDENFKPIYLDWVAEVCWNEYYVNMMRAWYFATALAKQYDAALEYLKNGKLDGWTHNKTIQKAIESRRIDEDRKTYLKTLRTGSKK